MTNVFMFLAGAAWYGATCPSDASMADEDWKVKAPKNAFKLICKPNMNLTPQAQIEQSQDQRLVPQVPRSSWSDANLEELRTVASNPLCGKGCESVEELPDSVRPAG